VKADLILIGSRGLSDIQGFLLGSISRQVASIARCSVFVVKQPIPQLTRVVLAVDDSKHSRAAARFFDPAFFRNQLRPPSLSAERLRPTWPFDTSSKAQVVELEQPVIERATRLVTALRDEFLKEGYAVDTDADGPRHRYHRQTAEADHADLLVIGSRDLTKSERLHLGSVSRVF
jgi:nucleotide-binding universal stress UspA family protein